MGAGLLVVSAVSALDISQGLLAMLTAQDILAFIVPAVVAMAIFYFRPLHAMCLDRAPGWTAIIIVVLFYIISLPAMNWLVELNKSMALPAWMSGIEQAMIKAEEVAAETTKQLLDFQSIWMLIACTFVVGFMAGLSEEMLFRGAMLRTMQDSRLGTHAAVWITAIIFSAIHLQFYGFVPRLLLGVWLGYLLVWTRSLWVPIIAHTLNNATVVVMSYLTNRGVLPEGYGDNLGLPSPGTLPWLAITSLIASIALAIWTARHYQNKNEVYLEK
jgi:membrane protease YdiL (CAAX protease family)